MMVMVVSGVGFSFYEPGALRDSPLLRIIFFCRGADDKEQEGKA